MTNDRWEPQNSDIPDEEFEQQPDMLSPSAQWAEPEEYPPYAQQPGYPPGYDQQQYYAEPPGTEPTGAPGGTSTTTWLVAIAACTAVIAVGALLAAWLVLGRDDAQDQATTPTTSSSSEQQVAPAPEEDEGATPTADGSAARTSGSASRSEASPSTSRAQRTSSAPEPTLSRPAGAVLQVDLRDSGADAVSVATVLATQGDNINNGDFSAAWAQQTEALQSRNTSLDSWSQGMSTTQWQQLTVRDVSVSGDTATADTRLRTTQDPEWGDGHECLDWDLTYTLVRDGDSWLIDRARGSKSGC